MTERTINHKTNSYFTENEHTYLTNLGFSWSNESNKSYEGHDNCLYMEKDSVRYDLEIRKKGFILNYSIPSILDTNNKYFYDIDFDELKNKLNIKKGLSHFILKYTSRLVLSIYTLLILVLSPIFAPIFIKVYDGRKFQELSLINKIKSYFYINIKKFNPFQNIHYFLLNELRTHNFVFVVIFITSFINYLIFS